MFRRREGEVRRTRIGENSQSELKSSKASANKALEIILCYK